MYVDPERQIYKKLGMKRGENYDETGKVNVDSFFNATKET